MVTTDEMDSALVDQILEVLRRFKDLTERENEGTWKERTSEPNLDSMGHGE